MSRMSAIGSTSRRPGRGSAGSYRLDPTARRRQTRKMPCRASSAQMTSESMSSATSRGPDVVRTIQSDGQRARRSSVPGTARPGGGARRRGGRAPGSARRGRPGCSAIGVGAAWRSPDRCRAHSTGVRGSDPSSSTGGRVPERRVARWPGPVHGPGERRRVSSDRFPLASGQAVRRLTLDQEIEGSNPSSPASSPTGSPNPCCRLAFEHRASTMGCHSAWSTGAILARAARCAGR